jgi:hypothetical protein
MHTAAPRPGSSREEDLESPVAAISKDAAPSPSPGITRIRKSALLLGAVLTQLPVATAAAQEPPHFKELHLIPSYCLAPCIDYQLSAELENDWIFAADPSSLTSNNLYPTLETVVSVAPVNHLRLVGDFIYEPVLDVSPGQSEAFNDLGLYADQLYAQLEAGPFNLQVGKIHPPFGRAWDVTPGLHGTDIADNYEVEERIGVDAAYAFDGFGIEHVLQVSAFTTDRTALSGSAFTHRPQTHLSDGGAGNTDGVSSFSVTLDGCRGASGMNCYSDGDFGYQLAGIYQKKGRDGLDEEGDSIQAFDERGLAASVNKSIAFDETTLILFGEAAYFDRFQGTADDALFLTASGQLEVDPMSYSLACSSQLNSTSSPSDELVELAASYDLSKYFSVAGEQWSIGAGYTFEHNEDQNTNTHLLGVLLTIDFNGKFP